MTDQSQKYNQKTFEDITSATSSPGSADGHSPCAGQDLSTFLGSGPPRSPANHSPAPDPGRPSMTTGIYGPSSSTWLTSANLQRSLVNKLQARLDSLGSTLYKRTWKDVVTPAGRSHSRLAVSAVRTKDNACTGVSSPWATPNAWDGKRGPIKGGLDETFQRVDKNGVRFGRSLVTEAQFTSWPTPNAHDHRIGYQNRSNGKKGTQKNVETIARDNLPTDQPVRLTDSGEVRIGSDAGMGSSGQLNPSHSRWLMGYPSAWDACAVTAMQSFPSKRKRSSKRS